VFHKVIVANRGAVAARILRTLHDMGIASVAVYSEADAGLPYLAQADETYCIGAAEPQASYLNMDVLLQVCRQSGADALHPGYGFLAENAAFARRVQDLGMTFIGPSPRWIEAMGHKTRARDLMAAHGMPMARSSPLVHTGQDAVAAARAIGYPVLIKPAAGGGGIGMLPAHDDATLTAALVRAAALAQRSFGSAELYLEQLMYKPRHIEFQILADRAGKVMHLHERDCSVQRRHQKVIEEAPAPGIDRAALEAAAASMTNILATLGYDVIGTLETLHGADDGRFQFLEMNTRLQVEHAVTEEVTGVDLVAAQIRLAAGEPLDAVLAQQPQINGHAIEARIYAEDPVRFFPSPGVLRTLRFPSGLGIRVETGYAEGSVITPHYDPMIAKLIVHAPDRARAIEGLIQAIDDTEIVGVKHNLPFVRRALAWPAFGRGDVHTGLAAEVLAA